MAFGNLGGIDLVFGFNADSVDGGFLGSYNTGFVYSFRKLYDNYTGNCFRVRRLSDNAEQDIGFVGNYADIASYRTFTSGTSGVLVGWYNQSPGAQAGWVLTTNTATQSDIVLSPELGFYVDSDTADAAASRIGLTTTLYTTPTPELSGFTDRTVLVSLRQQAGSNSFGRAISLRGDTSVAASDFNSANGFNINFGSSGAGLNSLVFERQSTSSATTSIMVDLDNVADVAEYVAGGFSINGGTQTALGEATNDGSTWTSASDTSFNTASISPQTYLLFGDASTLNSALDSWEYWHINTALSQSQLRGLLQNQYNFANNVPTPLAVTSDAYFSFRLVNYNKLNSPIVRLRRSSDNEERDFFVDTSTLYLDTSAITTWLSGSTAFITTWYDQSPNGYHVSQTLQAKQPTLTITSGVAAYQGSLTTFLISDNANPMIGHAYTAYGVIQASNPAAVPQYWLGTFNDDASTAGNQNLHVGIRSSTQYTIAHYFDDANFTAATSSTALEIHQIEYNDPGSEYTINGAAVATSTNPTGDLSGTTKLVVGSGEVSVGVRAWRGVIRELVVVNPANIIGTEDNITTILNNYYGAF